jgi:hypothetical protein
MTGPPVDPAGIAFAEASALLTEARSVFVRMAATLALFDCCLDRLSGQSARGMTQQLEGGLVKPREALRVDICTDQGLYALQPRGKRRGWRQRSRRIERDHPAFSRTPGMLEAVIAGAACQLSPWLRLYDQRNHIGRYPTGKQVGVSGVRKQGDLHSRRHLQCGKDLLPPHLVLLRRGECTGQQQSWLGLRSRRATHGPMATEGEPHFAALPRTNAFLGVMQEREESAAGEGTFQYEEFLGREATLTKRIVDGREVVVHRRLAFPRRCHQKREPLGLSGIGDSD